jgi:hypothetical protein
MSFIIPVSALRGITLISALFRGPLFRRALLLLHRLLFRSALRWALILAPRSSWSGAAGWNVSAANSTRIRAVAPAPLFSVSVLRKAHEGDAQQEQPRKHNILLHSSASHSVDARRAGIISRFLKRRYDAAA